jgi:hypothetical protein
VDQLWHVLRDNTRVTTWHPMRPASAPALPNQVCVSQISR